MTALRTLAAASAALALLLAAAGCGLGAGGSGEGEAELRVTRDYGSEVLLEATAVDPATSDTVMRFLDREAEITTRFGGGFVQSIEGISGGVSDGRSVDWFFYVNGVESAVGAAEAPVRPGDRIWWDHRDWTDAMRVPAVVGSYPEPLAQAAEGAGRDPVRVECAAERTVCDEVAERLASEGVDLDTERFPARGSSPDAMRVLVGEWRKLREDRAAAAVEDGPATGGVFAGFDLVGGAWELVALDRTGEEAERARSAGLLAATVGEGEPPTWLVTGTDAAGVAAASGLLEEETLRDRYALGVAGGLEIPLPAGAEG